MCILGVFWGLWLCTLNGAQAIAIQRTTEIKNSGPMYSGRTRRIRSVSRESRDFTKLLPA